MKEIKTTEDWQEFVRQIDWAYEKADEIIEMIHEGVGGYGNDIDFDKPSVVSYRYYHFEDSAQRHFDSQWMLLSTEELKPVIDAYKADRRKKLEEHRRAAEKALKEIEKLAELQEYERLKAKYES